MRTPIVLTTLLLATLSVPAELFAQRGQRRRGEGRRPQPAQAPREEKKPEKKPEAKPVPPIAYTNATVYVGDTTVYSRATVLLRGSKIEAVGPDVELPKDCKVVDCSGQHICPGFVIFKLTNVGAPTSVRPGENYADAIDPFNTSLKRALAAGITSYLTLSTTSGSTPSGTSAIIKLIPERIDDTVLRSPAVHAMSVPLGADAWRKLEENVEKAKTHKKELAVYEKAKAAGDKNAKAPRENKSLEGILSVMDRKTRLLVSGSGGGRGRSRMPYSGGGGGMTVTQIREALRLAKLFGVSIILDNPTEAWIVADEIAATSSSCTLQPRSHSTPDPTRTDPNGSNIEAAAILAKAGVPVTLLPPGGIFGGGIGSGGILGNDLNTPTVDPCFAIRGGMDEKEALSTITLYPAMMLGVDDRIGSLEAGKDGDLLILDGEPLHYKTFVQTAIVQGRVVYEKDKEPFYRHIRPKN